MNEIIKFKKEKEERIIRQGNSERLKQLTQQWMIESERTK